MKIIPVICGLLGLVLATVSCSPAPAKKNSAVSNAIVLIIRHAEKPETGSGLSAEGEARARACVNYFSDLQFNGQPLKPDYLFAAADSKASHRSRLTLEPTAKALGLTIDSRFQNKKFQEVAKEIQSKPHGKVILIAWHHSEIPGLLRALGANPAEFLPAAKWPDAEFGWLIQLRYDADGKLAETQLLHENLSLAQTSQPAPAAP